MSGSVASLPAPQPTQSFSFNPDNSLKTVGASAVTNDNDGNVLCIAGNICSPGTEFSYDERGYQGGAPEQAGGKVSTTVLFFSAAPQNFDVCRQKASARH
jgi:hypothetical protein